MPAKPKTPPRDTAAPAALGITASAEQILEAIGPINTIIEEKWPLGFETAYWLGKLLARLTSESKAIEKGRQSLLHEFAELTESGELRTNDAGNAVFPPGAYARFSAKWEKARTAPRALEGVKPLRVSDIPEDTLRKLRAQQLNGAPLGVLSGTPFFVEDAPLFG